MISTTNNIDSFKPSPRPPFPSPGSTTADGRYFSVGKLGRGTFCEINKCIDLSFHHRDETPLPEANDNDDDINAKERSLRRSNMRARICAAKIEHSTFANSGLLDSEANVLRFLSANMNNQTPNFCDFIRPSKESRGESQISAIIMEYLPGEDMHQLRDRHAQISAKKAAKSCNHYKRLKLADAVYLCADVILPLVQSMHDCGMIHRDVKPSNCVRNGTDENDKTFKLVDFGLSKSFIVPKGSYADLRHPWDKAWCIPENFKSENETSIDGYMRKERDEAEFRGSSMYASLRVHQDVDHCRRDDIWGLMYVFCDLVSGGLPWMVYAANRDRSMCQRIKEWVHGERLTLDENDEISNNNKNDNVGNTKSLDGRQITTDRVEELLKGADYHTSKYEKEMSLKKQSTTKNKSSKNDVPIVPPLGLSQDQVKINALRNAFNHLAELSFFDEPNYSLIEKCIREFLRDGDESEIVKQENLIIPEINWKQPTSQEVGKRRWEKIGNKHRDDDREKEMTQVFSFADTDDLDPHIQTTIDEAESLNQFNMAQQEIMNVAGKGTSSENYLTKDSLNYSQIEDLKRLPMQLQFHLAQIEYNALHSSSIPIHLALRDWINLASTLVYDEWNTSKYERGNHRSNDDGYRRQMLMRVSEQCLKAAKPFNNFCDRNCFYFRSKEAENGKSKRRKIVVLNNEKNFKSDDFFLGFSKLYFSLKLLVGNEKNRLTAPPPTLSI